MKIKRTQVRTYSEEWVCGDCGGEMVPTGLMQPSFPARHPHTCNGCGVTRSALSAYPRQVLCEGTLRTGLIDGEDDI